MEPLGDERGWLFRSDWKASLVGLLREKVGLLS